MLNEVNLIGNLGRDPEIRNTQTGGKVANLSLATTEKWKDKSTGERREKTEWHRVVIFGPVAEVAEKYLRKGSKVYVKGKLQTRKWTDQSGNDRYTTEVVLSGFGSNMVMLGGRGDGEDRGGPPAGGGAPSNPASGPYQGAEEPIDDIPF